MRIAFQVFLLTIFTVSSHAFADRLHARFSYYPQDFYNKVDGGEYDSALKKSLYTIVSSVHRKVSGRNDEIGASCPSGASCYRHTALGYNPARKILFGELHLERYGNAYAIRDVYCQHLSIPADYKQNPPGPGQIPDPNILNTEHTWPQSRFNGRFNTDMQKSDLHILYPSLARANTSRSNNQFSEVVTTLTTPCSLSKRGYASNGGSIVYFEPPESHKGNVARAILYFSIRYQSPVAPEEEASLRAWHRMDPPDQFEIQRNETIFSKQKVRNPFIDHPELIELISDF